MTASPETAASPPELLASTWEDAGRRAAASLDACSVGIVIGQDAATAGLVALGIGWAQAQRRRVVICDLVGDLDPLRQPLPPQALHGLVDYLFYGVSLARAAYPIDAMGNLLILPSGAGPLDLDSVLREERWGKLVRRFREAGGLMLIVVDHGHSDELPALSQAADGAVLAGDVELAGLSVPVLATARLAPPGTPEDISLPINAVAPDSSSGQGLAESPPAPPERAEKRQTPRILLPVEHQPTGSRAPWIAAVLALLLIVVGVVQWNRGRDLSRTAPRATPTGAADRESVPALSDSLAARAVGNPGDSAAAAAFVVEVMAINSQAAADSQLAQHTAFGFPANTYTPLLLGTEKARWYRLTTGAFSDSTQADSLIRTLRAKRGLSADAGRVLLAPYTLLIQRDVPPSEVPDRVRSFRVRGQPVYALLQDDGTARLFAGAFETPEQASLLLSAFATDSTQPSVVYRVGSVF